MNSTRSLNNMYSASDATTATFTPVSTKVECNSSRRNCSRKAIDATTTTTKPVGSKVYSDNSSLRYYNYDASDDTTTTVRPVGSKVDRDISSKKPTPKITDRDPRSRANDVDSDRRGKAALPENTRETSDKYKPDNTLDAKNDGRRSTKYQPCDTTRPTTYRPIETKVNSDINSKNVKPKTTDPRSKTKDLDSGRRKDVGVNDGTRNTRDDGTRYTRDKYKPVKEPETVNSDPRGGADVDSLRWEAMFSMAKSCVLLVKTGERWAAGDVRLIETQLYGKREFDEMVRMAEREAQRSMA